MSGDLRIVADENIPWVEAAFGRHGTVRLLPGAAVTPEAVRDADVLLVRSVTRVDADLVAGARVRFVGSATIGTDHVDQAALAERGIAFAHAPGSNAGSVVEYVLAALLRLSVRHGEALRGRTVGVVGCGAIGERLARRLPAFGARVLRSDPPRAEREGAAGFVDLDALLAEADVVTLHVPLTADGPHPTRHLLGAGALARMRPDAWLVNAARGAVVDNAALRAALAAGRPGAAVLDVWEGEPVPDAALVEAVALGTPHVAGYSYDGKVAGTRQLYDAFVRHLGVAPQWDDAAALAPGPADRLVLTPPPARLDEATWLDALVRPMYDVEADDARFRPLAALPPEARAAAFVRLRKAYPRRRAFERHTLPAAGVPAAYREAVEQGLGVTVRDDEA